MTRDADALLPYLAYTLSIEDAARLATQGKRHSDPLLSPEAVLDGQPSKQAGLLLPDATRKKWGIYFSGSTLSERTLGTLRSSATSRILDPACGAGDLLLAVARNLPVGRSLGETLAAWGRVLFGRDIHEAFVRATKARLVILAAERTGMRKIDQVPALEQVFPNIRVGDGLELMASDSRFDHVIMNPPFHKMPAPNDCQWGSGNPSAAAVFVQYWVENARPGSLLTAILPDVLRSGTNYASWRTYVAGAAQIEKVAIGGRFHDADVDVFVLRLRGGGPTEGEPRWFPTSINTFNDTAEISVGPVVPHRLTNSGPWRRYVRTRELQPWTVYDADQAPSLRFSGKVFEPPFVAVRRTSSPSDRNRVGATIVTGTRAVAVENHLIVVEPRVSTLVECHAVLDRLRQPSVRAWLDERIRCRHITVSALSGLPLDLDRDYVGTEGGNDSFE